MPPKSLQKVLIIGAIVIATGLALWELQRILGGVSPTDKTGHPAVTASPSRPRGRGPAAPHGVAITPATVCPAHSASPARTPRIKYRSARFAHRGFPG